MTWGRDEKLPQEFPQAYDPICVHYSAGKTLDCLQSAFSKKKNSSYPSQRDCKQPRYNKRFGSRPRVLKSKNFVLRF